jgi:hypothetical protein
VAQAHNPSFLGGRDQEDQSLRSAQEKSKDLFKKDWWKSTYLESMRP